MRKNVVVLYGGESVEHDISIITALQAMKNLPENFDYVAVYMDKKGIWWTADNLQDIKIYQHFDKLAKNKRQVTFLLGQNVLLQKKKNKFVFFRAIDCVLNCCHGRIGEDGAVAGILRACKVANTASDVLSSALCMDKIAMKQVLDGCGIPSADWTYCDEYDEIKKIKYPCVVKPANLGSSIGISVCKNEKEFEDALTLAKMFDKRVLVERLIENLQEFNCACFVFQGKLFVSDVQLVKDKGEIYSFEDKYLSTERKIALAEKKIALKIKKLTEKIYKFFDCQGVVRVDFLYDEKAEKLYVNEINSIPGSLAFYLYAGESFKELLYALICEAISNKETEEKRLHTFESDALKIFEEVGQSQKLKK